jgi:hypothetical protein
MSRSAWISIGAAVGAFVSAPLVGQVRSIGLGDGSYVQAPWRLNGTIICRGGSDLLFEGPVTMPRRRADLVPPGNVVNLLDLQTYVDVSVRRVTFQRAAGPAGPEGMGLKQHSHCAYADRAFSEYFPPAIAYDAATEGPGPHGSSLFFDVAGYFEVQVVPGRVVGSR